MGLLSWDWVLAQFNRFNRFVFCFFPHPHFTEMLRSLDMWVGNPLEKHRRIILTPHFHMSLLSLLCANIKISMTVLPSYLHELTSYMYWFSWGHSSSPFDSAEQWASQKSKPVCPCCEATLLTTKLLLTCPCLFYEDTLGCDLLRCRQQ